MLAVQPKLVPQLIYNLRIQAFGLLQQHQVQCGDQRNYLPYLR